MQFLDLKAQYQSIKKEIDEAVYKVLDSGVYIGGEEVENFEKEIASFCGTKYAIAINSGTDALVLSLKALGVGEDDEVITSPFTFIATVEAIAGCGARPVFADIDPKTFNIDPAKIEDKITKKTKAIIPVHIFGQMADMDKIMEIAKRHKLFIIEDAAQAIGAEDNGRKAGSIGDFGCFSFFPSKNLGAYGDGGMIVTNSDELADKIKLLRNHGSSPKEKYVNLTLGVNSRLDALQAAILRVKLKYLNEWSVKRREKADYYNKGLNTIARDIVTPYTTSQHNHIFHQYTTRVNGGRRDELKKALNKNGIPTMVYYPLPLHFQPVLKYLGYKESDFPETEKSAKEVLSLPIYPELENKEQDLVIQNIKKFFKN